MGIVPPTTYINQLTQATQRLRGSVARFGGNPCSVYRLSSNSPAGGVLSGAAIQSLSLKFNRVTSRNLIENEVFALEAFNGIGDIRSLQEGDYVQDVDGQVYSFAQYRAPNDSLFMATSIPGQIYYAYSPAGNIEQQPVSGAREITSYGAESIGSDHPLCLASGTYAFQSGGTPATVYCGLQPLNRERPGQSLGSPTEYFDDHFVCYVPLLNGVTLARNMIINNPIDGSRYIIINIAVNTTGLVGNVCIVQKAGTPE